MILQNLAMPDLAEAIEANFTEEMACFGRARSQWELHKTPELYWLYCGPGELNGVLLASFASDDDTYVHAYIDEMLDFFTSRHTSFDWTTGPSTRPAHLASLLEAHRFVQVDQTVGMAVDLRALNERMHVNTKLTITEVENLDALHTLCLVEQHGFGLSEEKGQRFYTTYANAGFGKGLPWHHYIGWLNDTPVASASLLYHAGVAGIYGISTIPAARRQGVATTMTLHALREARTTGYRVAVLSPTDMSEALYRRIGFQTYCTLVHYEWVLGD
ncbi:MAG TPA: GNAT family N-acetyltransferase [Ktedonobacteraceae bacterium]|nr:GNAT family N-acetyltransferase [Ktedonobacteraceae bacterium]